MGIISELDFWKKLKEIEERVNIRLKKLKENKKNE